MTSHAIICAAALSLSVVAGGAHAQNTPARQEAEHAPLTIPMIETGQLPGTAPTDLFSGLPPARIQPTNGNWSPSIIDRQMTGCPPMFANALNARVPESAERPIEFSDPFHPGDVLTDLSGAPWSRVGANGWVTDVMDAAPESSNQGEAVAFRNQHALVVHGSDRIETWTTIRLALDPMVARMMGGGGDCRIEVRGEFNRVG